MQAPTIRPSNHVQQPPSYHTTVSNALHAFAPPEPAKDQQQTWAMGTGGSESRHTHIQARSQIQAQRHTHRHIAQAYSFMKGQQLRGIVNGCRQATTQHYSQWVRSTDHTTSLHTTTQAGAAPCWGPFRHGPHSARRCAHARTSQGTY
jgi:hypothetical protein